MLFGLIVTPLGMAISTVILIVLASAASQEFRPKEALIAAILLAVLAVGVFVVGLKLQLPIWPTFFAGLTRWNCSITWPSASRSR